MISTNAERERRRSSRPREQRLLADTAKRVTNILPHAEPGLSPRVRPHSATSTRPAFASRIAIGVQNTRSAAAGRAW